MTLMDDYKILLEDVTTRLYCWLKYYEAEKNHNDAHFLRFGLFCAFENNWSKCVNTGIYNTCNTTDKYTETIFLKGFDWTKDQLRSELNSKLFEKWKSKFIKDKLKELEKDFEV